MKNKGWLAFFGLLLAVGAVGAVTVLVKGHHALGTSDFIPWGILIAAYVFFAVCSTGLCLVSCLGHVFGVQPLSMVAKRAVLLAIIFLIAGFFVLAMELGHPFNLVYILLSPNFTSAIFWMGALYSLYLVTIVAELHFSEKADHKKARTLGLLSFILGILAYSNLGSVFGFLHARPYWEGPYFPVYFILSALLSGTAILIVIFYLKEGKASTSPILPALSRLLALFVGVTIFFSFWKILSGLYGHSPGQYEALQALFTGPLWFSFWLLEVTAGMALPFALLLWKKERGVTFIAAVLVLVGGFFARYNMVIAGQIVPLEVIGVAPPPGVYHTYFPSLPELAIVAGAFGLTGFAYLLGETKLSPDHPAVTPSARPSPVPGAKFSH